MRYTGLALALLSSWCFAFSGPMAKYLNAAGLVPLQSVWVRMAGAGLLMAAVLALLKPRALRVPRGKLGFFAAYALVAVAGVQSLYFVAITRLPVGVALLLEFTAPVMVVLWVRFVRRVRLPRSAFVGAVVAFAGLAVVVEFWQGMRLDVVGVLLGLAAGACCAAYFLLSDSFGEDVDPLGLVTWGMLGAAVLLLPVSQPWTIPWQAFAASPTIGGNTLPALGAYLWLIVVATATAYVLGVNAVRRLSAAVGATVATLEVIGGAVVAWALLGEGLGVFQIVGGLLVLCGAVLAQLAAARPVARQDAEGARGRSLATVAS
ncbi:EamA family transporter [Thermoactinospora rubra]|uniref:EamA family transporter n=1 Tax=Thermoactinospora rubra TaxID=1088767 RepID=UPI000A11A75A|nr:EamA family transporter [Thermoactinospora rubra]